MRRVKSPEAYAAGLAALGLLLSAHAAWAQNCESARPTDAAGATGVSYGSAQVGFFDSASGRARVHYALSGPHAPPAKSTLETDVPDAVVVAAQAADDAFDKYAELKYVAPLSDGDSPCASNGDSDAVDIYLIHFAAADGQAVLDHCDAGPPKRCAGFVLVENDFANGGYASTEEGMRTVVPHELFHLVQDAYDADVERWWAEGSAQWAAKQVYPDLKDLERFLPAYFKSPWRPLNVPPNGVITDFLYATAIWPVYLQQRYGTAIVREVFESFDGTKDGVLAPTDAVLQAHGSSLALGFLQFAAFNAATGARAPRKGGYTNAADYPEVKLQALTAAPGELVSDVAAGLGAFYYSLSTSTQLVLSLDGDAARVAAQIIPVVDGKVDVAAAKPLPASVSGDVVVVVAGQDTGRTDAPFTLRASASGANGGEPKSSGCAVSGFPETPESASRAILLLAMSWLGRWRSKARRKGKA